MNGETFIEIEMSLKRLVEAVEKANTVPSWDTIISVFALIASWITIIFLLKERREKNRPYLQISFELVRSTLACIVLKNTGNCPLEIKSIKFNDDFIQQLSSKVKNRLLTKQECKIMVFPNQKWVLLFDTNVFNIINDFECKEVKIDYIYSKIGRKKKKYSENTAIDFEEYGGILDYISELDEFKNSVNRLNKTVEKFIDVSKLDDSKVINIKE